MSKQPSLNPEMRAILIDWLVEVQVSFPQTLAAKLDARKENYSLSVVSFLNPSVLAARWPDSVCLCFVQENFELYHETLYLAVKMADHYLDQTPVHREMLQLVGSTAMLIASKFEARTHSLTFN